MNKYIKYINSEEWHNKSKWFRNIMLNRCAVLPFLKSSDAHHMTYTNLEHEIFLRDVVPLSRCVHSTVHNICRVLFLKHDNHFIRFFVNWLLLRPSCLFWFAVLTLLNLLSKIIGRENLSITLLILTIIAGYLTVGNARYQVICGILTCIFAVTYIVFQKK